MADLICFPFRIAPTGYVVTANDLSDEYLAGELTHLIYTQPGERILVPDYGLTDPTFDRLNDTELRNKVLMFGPPIKILSIESDYTGVYAEHIVVEFDSAATETDEDDGLAASNSLEAATD